MIVGLGQSRKPRRIPKHRVRSIGLIRLCVCPRQKAFGTMEIVLRIRIHRPLQIWYGSREVAQLTLGNPASVERIGMIGARRDGPVIAGTSADKISVIQIEQPKFLEVSRGWIVDDGPFQFVNSASTRKNLKGTPQQPCVRDHLYGDINQSAHPVKQDHPYPEKVWASADEVHNRDNPQQDRPPRKSEEEEGL